MDQAELGRRLDLTQETFLRVWNRSETFDGTRGQLSSWIITVAKNNAINHLRSVEGRQEGLNINLSKIESTRSFSVQQDVDKDFYHRQQVQKGFLRLSKAQIRILKRWSYPHRNCGKSGASFGYGKKLDKGSSSKFERSFGYRRVADLVQVLMR